MAGYPLDGVRVVEFAGIGPGPFCGQMLADMGADVVLVERPGRGPLSLERSVERRGKRSVVLDLKSGAGREAALALAGWAELLIEGLRPGAMERLGLGPGECQAVNPALVYGRVTGWGQEGPWAQMAGHDLSYLAITGALGAMGPQGTPPPPPLNLLGDFGGGGMLLAMGLLAGLTEARTTGRGRVVDAAICDGVSAMMGMIHSWHAAGRWSAERGANILDGSAPYYRCYETSDGEWMAVAAIEPAFHAALLSGLGIDAQAHGGQHDRSLHASQTARIAAVFRTRSQADWSAVFEGTDACAAPVLRFDQVEEHPHNAGRGAVVVDDGLRHPARAPRFSGCDPAPDTAIPGNGADTEAVLREIGVPEDRIAALVGTR